MKRLISGIKPTGIPTLGNYIGAMKQFVKLQDELDDHEILIFIADLHAITTPQNRLELRKQIKSLAALYIAVGLDPKRVKLFIQSEINEHAALSYIMESTSYMGEMSRMTQFKDQNIKGANIRTSLFTYPALMSADILLYDASLVPVGDDQVQHLELTRNLAERFNRDHGNTFIIPKAHIPKAGARIKDLQDPTKKMSKSDDEGSKGYILLLDDINQMKNKIRSAVTDSDRFIKYDEINKPGISNLLTIYSSLTNYTIKELEEKYQDESYKTFKEDLAEVVANEIKPIQDKYNEIINSKELDIILDEGRDYASMLAKRKLERVYHRLGLGRKK